MFDPVASKILGLLQSQLNLEQRQNGEVTIKTGTNQNLAVTATTNAYQTVILVGGFGDSVYLNAEVNKWCQKSGIRLICPQQP